jgi:lipopolysaccharide/colanic/teichoic acid biosynthesis glycosyltransferase
VYPLIKACGEWLCAAVMLALALPLIAVAALLVKLTSRGPVFYSQVRLGRGGRPYRIYKIRTMYHNCESQSGARWATRGDSRITPVGRFLRKTHLDELPQLWNVVRGDMSLVGPRPERPEFIPHLERHIARYRERMAVRPGLTGLAQIQLPADTDLDSVRRKLAYDLYYIEHEGWWLDLRILLSTGLKVLHIPFGVARAVFRVPSGPRVEARYREVLATVPAAEPELIEVTPAPMAAYAQPA